VWVLTGDKEETAINIAFACELFDTRTKMLVLNTKEYGTAASIRAELDKHGRTAQGSEHSGEKHALVLDGDIISLVMADASLQLALLQVTQHCQSVIACRCAPSQKAQLVGLVKRNVKGAITLSIGDGANDVAMIQEAHVGVGISGQEGMQAANAADFSFGQFRFLLPLLLIHGRNSYRRMSTLVVYIFYKNTVLILIVYWYLFYSAVSGSRLYIEAGVQGYNLVWTSLPIIICGLMDVDVSHELSLKLPQLYHLGVRRVYFNAMVVLRWCVLDPIFESLVAYYFITYATSKLLPLGVDPGVTILGDYAYPIVLITVTLKLHLRQYQWTRAQQGMMLISVLAWWPLAWLFSLPTWLDSSLGSYFYDYAGIFGMTLSTPAYWLLLLLIPSAVMLPQLFLSVYHHTFYPEFRDLARECEYWKLPLEHLERWSIPLSQRRLPLRTDAPRPLKPSFAQNSRLMACVCHVFCGNRLAARKAMDQASS